MDYLAIWESVSAFFVSIGLFIHHANDIIKLAIIILCITVFWKAFASHLIKFTSWLAFQIFSDSYIQSYFLSKRMMKLFWIVVILLMLNALLPILGWTFNANNYIASYQAIHGTNGLGKNLTEMAINNQNTSVQMLIKNAPALTTGKVLSNILYLLNLSIFLYWLSSFLTHNVRYFSNQEKYSKKPLHGFAQIIFIVFFIIVIATAYAHYTDQSPITLFTTLSVMSVAVFMTLKDIIMGVISTIIIMSNDLVKVGDWITNSKYNADGHVVEISLTTVKVMNFDKTISNIPTYSFISEGFQNQQEMINSGLRRLKKTIRLDASSIRFLEQQDLEKLSNIQSLRSYIEHRSASFAKYNVQKDVDYNNPLNGKRLTNLDLYRKYIELYLKEHPLVYVPNGEPLNSKMNMSRHNRNDTEPVVHLTEGTKEGIGLEVYCFLKNAEQFQVYESQGTQIMTRMYGAAALFDLKVNC